MSFLILVRHGQSILNLENKFTGWVDVDLTKKGESEAEKAGWELVECTNVLTHIKTSRIDDGKYDHKTYSFYPGTRCGWCGSSSIRPFFIGEAQCIACHCKLDAIEPRDNLNLSDDWQ